MKHKKQLSLGRLSLHSNPPYANEAKAGSKGKALNQSFSSTFKKSQKAFSMKKGSVVVKKKRKDSVDFRL